jgi:hypothetical protein
LFQDRKLWFVKHGNAEKEWEDACCAEPSCGVAAVSDGASEGIFARSWAGLLTNRYVRDQPNFFNPDALLEWLDGCRTTWRQEIDFPHLRWSQQVKVLETGAGATLLSFRLLPPAAQADGKEEACAWEAWAVGDSCLFWVRDNQLQEVFPIRHSKDFPVAPSLLQTKSDEPVPMPLCSQGRCRPGDVFILATDAVAEHLLGCCEAGSPPDWEALEAVDEAAWREQITAHRQTQKMVNDDCTLLFLRISRQNGSQALAGNSSG